MKRTEMPVQSHQEFLSEVAKVSLVGISDLKKSMLLKRRLQWEGDNVMERFVHRRKVQVTRKTKHDLNFISCPICMEVLVKSTTTVCGHCFCERCIFECLLRKPQCPICRASIKNQQFLFSQALDNQIRQILTQNDEESQLTLYQERSKENEIWNQERKAFSVEVGGQLDVLDNDHVWCVGKVLQVEKTKNGNQVLVRYDVYMIMTFDESRGGNKAMTNLSQAPPIDWPRKDSSLEEKVHHTIQSLDIPHYLPQSTMFSYMIFHQDEEENRSVNFDVIDLISILFRPSTTGAANQQSD